MNGQDLRNSILQLAIQGKLVEQREADRTANELLEQIKVEKEKLIKEGKIKKEKKLPEIMKEEIPFDIPENWKWVRLRELGITQTGNTPSKTKKEYFGDFIPFISPGDIFNGVINYQNQGLSEKGEKVGRVSEKYSILQVCIGGSIGKCAINLVDVSYNQQINSITPLICNHLYVYFLLNSKFFLLSMLSKATGTATPIINKTSWEKLLFPLPPLEEQKRIVAKIEELITYVDKYDLAYSELEGLNKKFPEDMRKSILQYAIQGKLVEQREEDGTAQELYQHIQEEKKKLIKEGKIKETKALPEISEEEIPFDIPETWKWVRIAEMSNFQEGPGIMAKDFRNSGIPLIRIAGMQGDKLSLDGCNYLDPKMVEKRWNHFKLDLGDIIISTSASMDKICEVTEETVGTIPYTGQIRFKMYGNVYKEYFKYFIMSNAYIKQINEQKSGGTIKHYGPTHLKKMIIPLPPLREQKRIVEKIEELLPYTKQLIK
ncbi:restriction endonuclease subunit S [Paenibacillus cucumis (ex Kampfer et al. 2016)]|uniref:Restriction endonuclease subunit S n=1 Tax=Paenibacillus cucumis (ex Kampfer et al. 2016) TaxID=1776858 RepID=A0ABS7KG02_9BACL|nr:restriction endonuclease subunit S [Paenibacillus cucumis (ex Kampfer et al. 2016)]MBY0203057.1 restriction endonuclease subunit S [Paenibacillus cucumis (ex Kampfer et al. 2016)]